MLCEPLQGPLQGPLQAHLDPGDVVISSRTRSFSPSSAVSHSFSLKQFPSKWWQRWQPNTASGTALYNQRAAWEDGQWEDGEWEVGGRVGPFLTLLAKSHWLSKSQVTILEPMI